MGIRTDLAADVGDGLTEQPEGVETRTETDGAVMVTEVNIRSEQGARVYGKPAGRYITVSFPPLDRIADFSPIRRAIRRALSRLMPESRETVLVAGLGNTEITADSIGPRTAARVLATRHIPDQLARGAGLCGLKRVAVLTPGVLGRTGIEASELIRNAADAVAPDAVLAIDALASSSVTRLFRTVQLCDTGISPGSGVKNARKEISRGTLGRPVIAVGVPTVVDAGVLARELTGADAADETELLVTPKDSDLLCDRVSEVLSAALNLFLQPDVDEQVLLSLV